MSLRVEKQDDVTIVKPKGMLTGDHRTEELVTEIRAAINEGRNVLLDLRDTHHMSSIPIGQLVGLHVSAENHNVRFVLCNLSDRIDSLIIVFKLNEVFTIYDSRAEALAALDSSD